ALRALQAQGLLRSAGSAPFRSVVTGVPSLLGSAYERLLDVGQITVLDLVQLRGMLEIAAIERASLGPDPRRLGVARAAALAVGSAADESIFSAYLELHLALVRASGNRALLLTMEAVQGAMKEHLADAIRQVTAGSEPLWTADRLSDAYLAIVDALAKGDAER